MSDYSPIWPGLLGDPNLTLVTDPRIDPRLLEAMGTLDFDEVEESPTLSSNPSYKECVEFVAAMEASAEPVYAKKFGSLPPVLGVTRRSEVIQGVDGNEIPLIIHEPAEGNRPLPGILRTHGGGMIMQSATDPQYMRLADELAATGMVVVNVEFRNGAGKLGDHPFPAGLNDCASATRWTYANKDALGISHIVVSGESGGGNLCIATALKAKQEGWIGEIAGVYACCPYLAGPYNAPLPELMSLRENDYMGQLSVMISLFKVYDPTGDHARNPLAWPYHAKAEDLAGLPPHTISVNELDELRDEGLIYARKLMAAGVPTISRTVNGTTHGADIETMVAIMPDVYGATIRDIHGFATSLMPRRLP